MSSKLCLNLCSRKWLKPNRNLVRSFPPGIKMSWRSRNDVSLYVPAASQIKHPTASRWIVTKTSQWYISTTSYWDVVTNSQKYVTTTSVRLISTSPWRLEKVPNETPNDVSVVLWQVVSVACITWHDVPLARLYDVSYKSQIKHQTCCCDTSPPRLGVTFSRRLVSRSLLHIQITLP